MNEESLFAAALEKQSPAERQAFLQEACGDDVALRQRVERLLGADEGGGILERGVDAAAADLARPGPLRTDHLFDGRFKLRQRLGAGGMGEVWVADQIEPVQRRVALKVVRPGLDSARVLARFDQEAQALALMDHPNIAKVLDAGITAVSNDPAAGVPYFVMELIKGVSITQYCDDAKLSPRERLELFIPVCHAVQHAHQKGIIHRDLKPSNILVALYDGKPVPKVIDFGVAKATGPRLTEQSVYTEIGALVGTLEYMSPEQAELNNLDIDTRTDIYALGAVLYELLTGSVPFSRKELQKTAFIDMLRIIKEVSPPKPSTKLSGSGSLPSVAAVRQTEPKKLIALMRGELDWIVIKCLEKDRGRRYQTAGGLALDLQRYLQDEPVQAGPPSARYRLRKFAHRHWRVLAAASAFVLLLVTAVVMLTVALFAVDRERRDKDAALAAEGKRRKQAREALDVMSSQIFEDWLTKQKVLLPEHKRFLELALRWYEEFAADTGQEEESRAGVAHAFGRVGFIRERLGQRQEAEAAFERSKELYSGLVCDFRHIPAYREGLARTNTSLAGLYQRTGRTREAELLLGQSTALYRSLAADFQAVPEYRRDLAIALNSLALAVRNLGRTQEADEAYRESVAVHKRLVAEFPADPDYRSELGKVYLDWAVLLDLTGRPQESMELLDQAVAVLKQLVADFPTEPRYRNELAISRNNLGNLLRDAHRYPEAEEVFRQSLTTRRELVAEFPAVPEYRRGLAMTVNNLGILFKNTDRPQEAEEMYRQSLEIHKRLADEFPTVSDHQNELAGAMNNLGRLLLARKDVDGARRLLEGALAHHQAALKASPDNLAYRRFYRNNRWRLTETFLEMKDHAAAAATAKQFLDAAVEPPRDAYTAACLFAGCARLAEQDKGLSESTRQKLVTSYGDSAIAALRQAIHKGAKEVARMKTDANLDPIRARDDFQKLLAD